MPRPISEKLFSEARSILVGGVNSPVRAFKRVGGTPPFIVKGKGAHIWDADGHCYIDYVASWGSLILGHANPEIVATIESQAGRGTSFGAPTELETKLAQKIRAALPSMERLRFVNSGTEAAMSAVRLARGFTGRQHIIKFDGCYHGHADHLLVKAGSGALSCGAPDSAGVPPEFAQHTLVARYNALHDVDSLFRMHADAIAAVIVEPVAGNIGCVPPAGDFLPGLRKLCDQHRALLIFDEVMTGFRVGLGGAQGLYHITPDLTCLGKIIGGGLPVGAYGGRADIMARLAPEGDVYQAGTLSGNPLAMAVGLKTLELISRPGFYDRLNELTATLIKGLSHSLSEQDIPHTATHVGSMWGLFFSQRPVASLADVHATNQKQFTSYFHGLLNSGIYLAPSPYEAGFLSASHTIDDIHQTVEAARHVQWKTE